MKNILQEPLQHLNHIHLIKAQYLQAQIDWMHRQSHVLLDLINMYKRKLQYCSNLNKLKRQKEQLSQQSQQNYLNNDISLKLFQDISPKIQENLTKIQQQLEQQKPKLLLQESIQDHCQLSKEQLWRMIFSFQQQIQTLKNISQRDQKIIQQLQNQKQNRNYFKQKIDHSSIMKTVQSYNIHHKVYQKYKRKITNLKIKRKNLQKAINFMSMSTQQRQTTLSQIKDKSFLISELQQPVPRKNKEIMTGFQQTLLIYKKKKYMNQKLKMRNNKLKLAINDKQAINRKLQQILCEDQWNEFNFSQFINNHQSNNNFSLLNSFTIGATMNFIPKIYESFRFDQDISKIIPS